MTQTPGNERAAQAARIAAKPWYRQLYVHVLVAIVIGIVLGWRWPDLATAMEPIGTTFITAMKLLIGPIVFLTIIGGISGVANLKQVGLTGIKALTYFQVGTILAMATGLVAMNIFRLGDGVHADPATLHTSGEAGDYIAKGESQRWWEFLTHIVPDSVFGPFVEGDILQVIFLAVIFGIALKSVGAVGEPIIMRRQPSHRGRLQGALLRHEGRAARCVRRDGLRHREVRPVDADQPRLADPALLRHLRTLRRGGARRCARRVRTAEHLPAVPLLQGGVLPDPGHLHRR